MHASVPMPTPPPFHANSPPSPVQNDSARWQSLGSASLQSNLLSAQLLGSLPAGMSLQERNAVMSSSVLSPTQSALSSLPSSKLAGRTMEGKKLRRHVLRGAVIVFVTAGYSGKKCVRRGVSFSIGHLTLSSYMSTCIQIALGLCHELQALAGVRGTRAPDARDMRQAPHLPNTIRVHL